MTALDLAPEQWDRIVRTHDLALIHKLASLAPDEVAEWLTDVAGRLEKHT